MKIDKEFASLIEPLSDQERRQLEENIVSYGGARDPLVVWRDGKGGILLDGHNRYEICTRLGLTYEIDELEFADRSHAKEWMIRHQFGRRNLSAYQRTKLALELEETYAARAKANQVARKGSQRGTTCQKSDKLLQTIDTKKEVAKIANVSHDTVAKVKKIDAARKEGKVNAETVCKLRSGELSVNKVWSDIKREETKKEVVSKLEDVSARKVKELAGEYDVIVIDPPWPMKKIDRDVRPNQSEFDYPTMSEQQLAGMSMPYAKDCHMWLWTTHRFLPMAMRLLDSWGFKYVCTFVWHKPGGFQPIGLPQYNCEFAIYARRGSPKFIETKAFSVCFEAKRGKHSEKPEEFYNIVRRVTAGRRIDIFNRRNIDGFDSWGNEALQ